MTVDASVQPQVSIPLDRAAMCLDCEHVFAIGGETCPECGGRGWVLIARFFTGAERKVVRFRDVEHEVANGLTPGKGRAQLLARQLHSWIDAGVLRPRFVGKVLVANIQRIEQSIDDTMRRLRALGEPLPAVSKE